LQNQLNYLNNINNNNQFSIQNLQNNINIKDREIFKLKEELNKLKLNNNNSKHNMNDRSKTLAINFMSVSHDKIYPISCSNNDTIVKCEEIFYNEYP